MFCVYNYFVFLPTQLQSLPKFGGNSAKFLIFVKGNIPVEPEAPRVNFSCDKAVDVVTGLISFSVKWTYEYLPLIQESLKNYGILFQYDTISASGRPELFIDIKDNLNPAASSQVLFNVHMSLILMSACVQWHWKHQLAGVTYVHTYLGMYNAKWSHRATPTLLPDQTRHAIRMYLHVYRLLPLLLILLYV